jgi:RNase P/RNase MRP subunit POP5
MVRVKHRYLICQVLFETIGGSKESASDFNARDILLASKEKLQLLFGDVGSGTIGAHLIVKFFDLESMIFVLRTTRDAATDTWFALSCISEIKKQACTIRCLDACGCERSCFADLKRLLEVFVRNSHTGGHRQADASVQDAMARRIEEYQTLVDNIV